MRFIDLAIASVFAATILASAPALAVEKKVVPGGNLGIRKVAPPIAAGNTLECGGKTYKVKTGTNAGTCKQSKDSAGNVYQVICNDGENHASATCGKGCGATYGAGDCDLK
ncbi:MULTISPECIES: hypothetical protein [unclassified Ensifer]|uniref:hypothetical protein n=1 Tax=unclassified Ensifer TaxID=2633371 RepID=UPI000A9088F6|nr:MULTISPECIES: hypothetical protein [unclassified Ensifer]